MPIRIPKKRPLRAVQKWTKEEIAMVGQLSDAVVARRLGRSPRAVKLVRLKLGLPQVDVKQRRWTQAEDALLGALPDLVVAKRINRNLWAVYHRRYRLGIPRYGTGSAKIGTAANRALSQPPFTPSRQPKPRRWTPEEDALLETLTPQEAAAKLNRTLASVRYRYMVRGLRQPLRFHWTPKQEALLGTMTDAEVAKKLGCRLISAAVRRRKLHIPAHIPNQRAWTEAENALLGTMTDEKTAQVLNRHISSVRTHRFRLGIPCLRKTGAGR